ncbi:hypothetical protein DL98DRAFT_566736 [Cadophora sp. DSE1049]|nr:hypothetical protein DL98DRAFT_566736 [Cadophora sp. DSE1049]
MYFHHHARNEMYRRLANRNSNIIMFAWQDWWQPDKLPYWMQGVSLEMDISTWLFGRWKSEQAAKAALLNSSMDSRIGFLTNKCIEKDGCNDRWVLDYQDRAFNIKQHAQSNQRDDNKTQTTIQADICIPKYPVLSGRHTSKAPRSDEAGMEFAIACGSSVPKANVAR